MKKLCLILLCLSVFYAYILSDTKASANIAYQPATPYQKQATVSEIDFEQLSPDIAKVIQRGYLVVALPSADNPIFYEADEYGQLAGFDIDIATALAEGLGVDVVFDRSAETFSSLTYKLMQSEVDLVISTYSMTPERAMYVNFSDPYMETCLSVLIDKRKLVQNKIEDNPLEYMKSNPIRIGAESGTTHFKLAQELFPLADVVPFNDCMSGCINVASGELFAFFSVDFAFMQALESSPTLSLYATAYSFTDLKDQFCVGVSQNKPQLLNYVNAYLRTSNLPSYEQVAAAYGKRYGGNQNE